MADEAVVQGEPTVPTVDPAIEAEARRGGWSPKDQWRGDPARWIDAKEFVENGRRVLPHVQRHAARLEQENAAVKAQLAAQAAELENLKAQTASLAVANEQTVARERERARQELVDELIAARTAGDVAKEAQIIGKLGAPAPAPAPAAARPPAAAASPAAPTQPARLPQELTDWVAQNDWYQRDPILANAMQVVGAELRVAGQVHQGMTLTQQLDTTAREVLRRYAPPNVSQGNRVEGGGRPADGGPRAPQEGTWDSLPAHIKQACDDQGNRMGLVGPKALYKTMDEWRKHYVREYNRHNSAYDFRPPGN